MALHLSRRQFGAAALAGMAAPALELTMPSAAASAIAATPTRSHAGNPLASIDLDALTIPHIQLCFARGDFTSVDLTRAYLERIRSYDNTGINAVLAVNPNALRQAAESDRLRSRRHVPRSPLDGVPVLLKDNIGTRDQGATAGSRALLESRPGNATLVQRLLAAGAVIIGKANLSEWANFRSENSTSGWSAVGGLTGNPYDTTRTACGSSSGSAAGVAAAFSQVAIGTETNGSIVCPSGTCGVVGIKPTVGVVSRTGVVPITAEQDTAGPIARTVVDAALTLAVLAGTDRRDTATLSLPARLRFDVLAAAAAHDHLAGKRIGVWRFDTGSPETDAVTAEAVARLQAAGATTVDITLDGGNFGDLAYEAMKAEFKRDINAYLAQTPGRHPSDLAGLIEFNKADSLELKYFDQNIFEMAQAEPDADGEYITQIRTQARQLARTAIDGALSDHQLDAIMAPTNSPAWVMNLGHGDDFLFGSSGFAAVAGYPNLTVPGGYANGLPVGMSFFSGRWTDAALLRLGHAFESAGTPIRHAPAL